MKAWMALIALLLALVLVWGGCRKNDESDAFEPTCDDPQWAPNSGYVIGSTVQNLGQRYECFGHPGWCNQAPYEPDAENPFWEETWKHLGACTGGPDPDPPGNRITLQLPTNIEFGTGEASGDITGKLQCGTDVHPVKGSWGQTVVINDLKQCDYVLVMDSNAIGASMDAGRVIRVTEQRGQNILFKPRFRRLPDPARLKGLPGLKVELFASGLDQPRQMALNTDGTVLYVGSSSIPHWADQPVGEGNTANRRAETLYALELNPEKTRATATYVIATGLEEPHGVAYRNGALYYATTGSLRRVAGIDSKYRDGVLRGEELWRYPGSDDQFPLADVPPWRWYHQKHPLYFNSMDPADEHLYTAVGIPCNVCVTIKDPRYGAVMRVDPATGKAEVLARGVRNAGGLDWNPATAKIWFGDNNRDGFDNDDELNVIDVGSEAKHFGSPYVFGPDTIGITESEWERREDLDALRIPHGAILSDKAPSEIRPGDYTPPAYAFGSNFAPLGVRFWNGYQPRVGKEHMLVAVHSKGTDERPGMNITLLTLEGDTVESSIPLVQGWRGSGPTTPSGCMQENGCLGSPVEFLEMPDGSVLVSDDVAGVIYRISYDEKALPDTTLTLTAPAAPSPDIAHLPVVGFLTSPDGERRDFSVAWGQKLILDGMPNGDYKVEWKPFDEWVPEQREMHATLGDATEAEIAAKYVEKPDVKVELTLVAPARPAGALAEHWTVRLRKGNQAWLPVDVPWGGQSKVQLDMGDYVLHNPYTEKAYPEPMRERFQVDYETPPITRTATYKAVDDLGEQVLLKDKNTCVACHSAGSWDDPVKANRWVNNVDALKEKVAGMTGNMTANGTHCDGVCASEVARYLVNTTWREYSNPGPQAGPRQLRMLARNEYANTVRDILGVEVNPEELPENKADGADFIYPVEAVASTFSAEDVRKYYDVALKVHDALDEGKLAARFGGRQKDVISALGRELFRRPLSASEKARYLAVYSQPAVGDARGLRSVALAMLVSPNFLYRSEMGLKDAEGEFYTLTPFERATAMSYTLLGTSPDEALLDKAESGGMDTELEVQGVIANMMLDPRASQRLALFMSYYAGLSPEISVSPRPGLTVERIAAMRDEFRMTLEENLRRGSGSVREAFNPGYTYLNADLASHYGIGGVSGATPQKVTLSPEQAHWRGGILTGLFVVEYANDNSTSLVMRGFTVRQNLFCQSFAANALRPEPDGFPDRPIGEREKWQIHTGPAASNGTCWGCHKFFNDTGASMENYDQTAKLRETELAINQGYTDQHVPIDASGPFIDNMGGNWIDHIDDVRDIAEHIPSNKEAMQCLASGFYRYTMGARPDRTSMSTVSKLSTQLLQDDNLRELAVDMLSADTMIRRVDQEDSK
jgi:glucose/arabinose dehydrogenase